MSTNSTIRIELGAIEVECTATEDFLKAELPVPTNPQRMNGMVVIRGGPSCRHLVHAGNRGQRMKT